MRTECSLDILTVEFEQQSIERELIAVELI